MKEKILIVDDDPQVRQSLVGFLQDVDYQTLEAGDGRQALQVFYQEFPSLVLADLRMPVMDGRELIKQLHKDFPDIPVIVVSANGMLEDALEAMRNGAWDYITKPIFNMEALEYAIERALEKARLIRQNNLYAQRLEEKNLQLQQANIDLKATLTKLEKDEEAGRRIQFRLLPDKHKTFTRYTFGYHLLSSLNVTGDFVDYFGIDENHIGFYIADVSGHGVSSAFVTVIIKSHLLQYLDKYEKTGDWTVLDPGKILAELNRVLIKENIDKFTTIFYGVINVPGNLLRCANGGQFPFPVMVTPNSCRFLRQESMVVGMLSEAQFETQVMALPETFNLIMISDGVLDFVPGEDLAQKQENLLKICKPFECDMPELVSRFGLHNNTPLTDDITFLLLNRR